MLFLKLINKPIAIVIITNALIDTINSSMNKKKEIIQKQPKLIFPPEQDPFTPKTIIPDQTISGYVWFEHSATGNLTNNNNDNALSIDTSMFKKTKVSIQKEILQFSYHKNEPSILINYKNFVFSDLSKKTTIDNKYDLKKPEQYKQVTKELGKVVFHDEERKKNFVFTERTFFLKSDNYRICIQCPNTLEVEKFRKKLVKHCTRENIKKSYELMTILGRGSFSNVFLARDRVNKKLRAIKTTLLNQEAFKCEKIKSTNAYLISNEVDVLRELKTKNVCRIVELFEDENQVSIVLDYVEGLSLHDAIKRGYDFSIDEIFYVVFVLLNVVDEMNEKGWIHRDIKPSNIIIKNNKKDDTDKIEDYLNVY